MLVFSNALVVAGVAAASTFITFARADIDVGVTPHGLDRRARVMVEIESGAWHYEP